MPLRIPNRILVMIATVMMTGTAIAQAPMSSGSMATEWRESFETGGQEGVLAIGTKSPIINANSTVNIERAIQRYADIAARGGWPRLPNDTNLQLGAQGEVVALLRQRLEISGDLEVRAGRRDIFDAYVEAAVANFQKRHGLQQDGTVGGVTLQAMNMPVELRLKQLELNMARMRTMTGSLGGRYVMMNIPGAEAEAVLNGQVDARFSTVVGKIDRQSPILSVKITEVNFNPFWTVPVSIIRKDLIPKMQADPEYLTKNKIRIFDGKGQEVAPNLINWNTEEATRYRFRQDPGDFNSMGQVKITLPNPHSVYMHDTPAKSFFGQDFRFHSSGCARVQNVRDLVTWLLSHDNPEYSRERIDGIIRSGVKTDVRLKSAVPIYWVYFTAWANDDGQIQFRDDVYDRDGLGGRLVKPDEEA